MTDFATNLDRAFAYAHALFDQHVAEPAARWANDHGWNDASKAQWSSQNDQVILESKHRVDELDLFKSALASGNFGRAAYTVTGYHPSEDAAQRMKLGQASGEHVSEGLAAAASPAVGFAVIWGAFTPSRIKNFAANLSALDAPAQLAFQAQGEYARAVAQARSEGKSTDPHVNADLKPLYDNWKRAAEPVLTAGTPGSGLKY